MPDIDVTIQENVDITVDSLASNNLSIDETAGTNVNVDQALSSDVKVTAISSNRIVVGGVGSGDIHYTYVQSAPTDTWVIQHDLNKKPSVTVVDSADTVVYGNIKYNSLNRLTITFNASFAGKAYLN